MDKMDNIYNKQICNELADVVEHVEKTSREAENKHNELMTNMFRLKYMLRELIQDVKEH